MQRDFLKSLLSKMVGLTAGRVLGAGCLFLITLVITRNFGPKVMAHYSLFLAMIGILAVVLPVGFQAFGSMITAEYAAHDQSTRLASFARYGQRLIFKCAAILALPLLAVAYWMPDPHGYGLPITFALAFVAATGMALTFMSGSILVGLEEPFRGQLPDMLIRPILLLGGFLLLGLMMPDLDILVLLGFAVLVYWLVAVVQYALLRKRLGEGLTKADAPESAERKSWWKLAPNWLVTTLLWDTFVEIHILLAVWLVSPLEVAMLHICFRIRQLAGFGMRSLYSLLLPKIFAANAKNDDAGTRQFIRLATRITLGYAVLVWLFVFQFGGFILGIFGSDYAQGQDLLLIILGTLIVRALFGPGPAILGMKRRQDMIVKILLASLALSVGIAALGFGSMGVMIIAIAYLAATSFTSIVMWWSLKTRSNIDCAVWA
jgi:O-antigen/teichoic acid export membrane protein